MPVQGGSFVAIPVLNQLVPEEGPKVITIDFDFSLVDAYTVDFTEDIQMKWHCGKQSMYCKNKSNTAKVTLNANETGFSNQCDSHQQGYRPMMFPAIPKVTIWCTGGKGIFRGSFLNVPMIGQD